MVRVTCQTRPNGAANGRVLTKRATLSLHCIPFPVPATGRYPRARSRKRRRGHDWRDSPGGQHGRRARAHQVLRQTSWGGGADVRGRRRGALRVPRTERRRQDDDDPLSPRHAEGERRRGVPVRRAGAARRQPAAAAARVRRRGAALREGDGPLAPRLHRGAARRDFAAARRPRGAAGVRPEPQGERALSRQQAEARADPRHDARPGAAHPR